MNGQKKNYSIYEKQMNDYIKNHNPYVVEPINMDLRAFERYVKKNQLSNCEITQDVVEKFQGNK